MLDSGDTGERSRQACTVVFGLVVEKNTGVSGEAEGTGVRTASLGIILAYLPFGLVELGRARTA